MSERQQQVFRFVVKRKAVMKKIELANGGFTYVCDCHYDLAKSVRWKADKAGYVIGFIWVKELKKQKMLSMGRLINNTPKGLETDHKNGVRHDNRCSNLRTVTRIQNMHNLRLSKSNTSGYKGVDFKNGKWRARIAQNGKSHHLGYFSTPEEAVTAYQLGEKEYLSLINLA